MSTDSSDEDLMLAYGRGDAAAFELLYERHRGPLFRLLLRGLSNRATAEECFQEVWTRVINARERYRPEAKFTTWLYQIANNLLIDQYRRAKPETDGEAAEAIFERSESDEAQPEQVLSDFEQRRRFQRVLEELPDEQRIAIQLRLEQALSLEEIGRITEAGRETVKSRIRYALARIRKAYDP
ncbi:MAG: RNA polymerase sigma factor [Lysobacteraceae bacterium]